uniref:Uncharacterized protein n=1 Tax=Acrobeloides nanus TaxID=290746 RepID=A0A914C172_9BILA
MYTCLFLIFLICNPFGIEAEYWDLSDGDDERFKRATGDPRATFIARIPRMLTSFLTAEQLGECFDLVTDSYFSGGDMSSLQSDLMDWAMSALDMPQLMSAMGVYNTLTTKLSDPMALLGTLVTVMTNNLTPFMTQVQSQMDKLESQGRSRNATLRGAYIMCCQFLIKPNIQKIMNNLKKKFTQVQCDAAYASLNPTFLNLQLYNFADSPCTGTGTA